VLHQGPIPRFLHSLIEYLAGIFLVVAPFLFNYKSGATAVSIVAGILVIFLAAISDAPLGLVPQIPVGTHAVLDLMLSLLFIAAPFIFGFSNESAPTAVFIAGGVVSLLISVGTRYLKEDDTLRSRRRLRRDRRRDRERSEGDALVEPPEFEPSPSREDEG
jgi:hypothetical protein